MKVVALMGSKGGAGRTMLAVQLARMACAKGGRPMILDSGARPDARTWAKDAGTPSLVQRVVGPAARGEAFRYLLEVINEQGRYTHVFIDEPPRAWISTAIMLLPFRPALPDMRALLEFAPALAADAGPIAVCNAARSGTSEAREALEFLAEAGTVKFASTVICDRVLFRRTFAAGKGVADIGASSKAKSEIMALYEELGL